MQNSGFEFRVRCLRCLIIYIYVNFRLLMDYDAAAETVAVALLGGLHFIKSNSNFSGFFFGDIVATHNVHRN